MKIAQLTLPIIPTPPSKYGGTERIASMLTEELSRRGHDVTLFATGDSKTKAKLKYVYKKATGIDNFRQIHAITQISYTFRDSDQFDVIHNHAWTFCLPLTRFIKTPVVTTMHNDYYLNPGTPQHEELRNESHFTFISRNQMERIKGLRSAGVVYNATDTEKYPLREEKKDYMFFIGNMTPSKGPDTAVKVAKQLKQKLIMAVKIDKKYEDFYNTAIKPHVDGKNIVLHRIVDFEKKIRLYQQAKCVLFPIRWEEPFGLVMTEAMSCGTPVVAMNHGSAPEIIKHGETGFIANNYKEFVSYVKRIDEIDPKKCRKWVEKKFSIKAMTDGYERVYRRIAKSS